MARIDDGFPTLITLANYPAITLWEKEVTPPGASAGGENDTTTMRNTAWRTRSPKKLKTLSNASGLYAYDPAVLTDIVNAVGENQQITITYPDGETWTFWGWMDEFTPQRITEGEQPTAECTFIPSNQNDAGTEVAPVLA